MVLSHFFPSCFHPKLPMHLLDLSKLLRWVDLHHADFSLGRKLEDVMVKELKRDAFPNDGHGQGVGQVDNFLVNEFYITAFSQVLHFAGITNDLFDERYSEKTWSRVYPFYLHRIFPHCFIDLDLSRFACPIKTKILLFMNFLIILEASPHNIFLFLDQEP